MCHATITLVARRCFVVLIVICVAWYRDDDDEVSLHHRVRGVQGESYMAVA